METKKLDLNTEETAKKNYVTVTYISCSLDYKYTICTWSDLQDNLGIVETDIMDADPNDFEKYGKPSIIIEPILMTDREYEKWFTAHILPTA
jgi:hypothetical protein